MLVNVGDDMISQPLPADFLQLAPQALKAPAKLEMELEELSEDDRKTFMQDLGVTGFSRGDVLRRIFSHVDAIDLHELDHGTHAIKPRDLAFALEAIDKLLRGRPPGSKVDVQIERQGQTRLLPLTLGASSPYVDIDTSLVTGNPLSRFRCDASNRRFCRSVHWPRRTLRLPTLGRTCRPNSTHSEATSPMLRCSCRCGAWI